MSDYPTEDAAPHHPAADKPHHDNSAAPPHTSRPSDGAADAAAFPAPSDGAEDNHASHPAPPATQPSHPQATLVPATADRDAIVVAPRSRPNPAAAPANNDYPEESVPNPMAAPRSNDSKDQHSPKKLSPDMLSDKENPQDSEAPAFFSMENGRVALVQAIGATMNGYCIGFVAVYSTLYGMSTNCASYRFESGCSTVPNANCRWVADATGGYCGWAEGTCSQLYPNNAAGGPPIGACNEDGRCAWSYSAGECQNPSGYSSSDNGIFAGSMIAGCLLGSVFAGPLATAIGAKISFLLVGLVGVVSSVMYHVSCAENEFWVLIVGRFVIGLFMGVIGVACPVYVDQNAHPKWKRTIGVLFQVFTTLGIFLAASMGLALGQSVYFSRDKDQKLMARMQGLCAVSTALSVLVIVLGIVVRDSRAKFDGGDDEDAIELDPNEYSYWEMAPRLIMGLVMAGTLQLTGINAVMNYAPTIMGSLGLAPLVGNFVVMVWNFVTTLISIPLSYVFTMRQLFLFGSIFTSCMCLFLCGIPVYPGVAEEKVKNGVAITGILLFILGFEVCLGPCYYVLTQDMFPPSFRPRGASFTQVGQFIYNLIINVCYPIATERISGGRSGNQDKGQSIAFIFFGGVGCICFIIEVFFLHPWDEEKDGKKRGNPKARKAEEQLAQ